MDTVSNFNIHKTFRRLTGRPVNFLCTFKLRPVLRGENVRMQVVFKCEKYNKLTIRSLREKCPYLELFWFIFSRIRTEYGEIHRISPYSAEYGKMRTRMTPNTDTFYSLDCNNSAMY